jgi:hypothetical protein
MRIEAAKQLLPIIQHWVNGETIEVWDSTQIVGTFDRGMWKTFEHFSTGIPASRYRMIKMGEIHHFDGRPNVTDTLNKYKF